MPNKNKIIYGPVDSRRLGKWKNNELIECGSSLGVNLSKIPTCSFDCIYCSCGETENLTLKPNSDYSLKEIEIGLKQGFKDHLKKQTKIDYISFVGWTEPTLHPYFNEVVDLFFRVKEPYFPKKPTAIFTNSTTLDRYEVKEALKRFDRTFFKLDAATNKFFQQINRPIDGIALEKIVDGLADFSEETNKVELSAMVLKTNYKDLASEQYVDHIKKIKPKDNKVYLCTPDWLRPTKNGKGISLMPEQEILEHVKRAIDASEHKAIILPPKREGFHPLIRK